MALIKSTHAPAATPFSMRDIEQQAQQLLSRARRAAETLLAEAQREAEQLRAQASKDGRAEGLAAGRAEGLATGLSEGRATGHRAAVDEVRPQLDGAWRAMAAAAAWVEQHRADLENGAVAEVVQLALSVARKVTKRQAAIDPAVLVENLREAMRLAAHGADLRIALNPAQRQTVADELPKLQMTWPNLKHVELVDDPDVAVGGCRVLTRHGEVDATVEAQLDRVIADLLPGS